ncbi:MAG: hypothetical protein JSU86_14955 [Phycisphaerales bacterium]|nr:MAG: hypothetical protein JSU86_14955 [Phycisphaerales bacterium]
MATHLHDNCKTVLGRRRPGHGRPRAWTRLVVGTLVLALADRAYATPPELLKTVPSDVVAAYFASGADSARDPGEIGHTLGLVTFLADQAHRVGLLSRFDAGTRVWLDTLAAASVVLAYPHTVVLFEIRAAARPDGGHRLARLHAALIVRTGGTNEELAGRIQHLLNTYTNSDQTLLSTRSVQGPVAFVLQDRRLPSWATITWGQLDDYYVIAVGDGAYDRAVETIADRTKSLAADPWFTKALTQANGVGAPLAWYVRFDKLYRDVDASLAEKISRVMSAIGLAGTQRALWTVGRNDRAVEAKAILRRNSADEVATIAQDLLPGTFGGSAIPEGAGGYAIIDCNPRRVLRGLCDAYLAAKSPHAQQGARSFWRGLQAEADVSIEQDIVAHLGQPLLIHDYPRHALSLPLAWTIAVPVTGDARALRRQLDRLLEAGRRRLAGNSVLQLRHDADGVWYIQYGLTGPGLVVTDKWLVASFSPYAVRENVAHLSPESGRQFE